HCAHGKFPVPTMATLSILGEAGIALSQCDVPHELVTPTGAALLAELVESFGPMEGLVATQVGYGLGGRDIPGRPNVLRAVLGTTSASQPEVEDCSDQVVLLQTNLDDCQPEWLGQLMELAFKLGALVVFFAPIYIKKQRPGVLLSLLCARGQEDTFERLMFRETTAFGLRKSYHDRIKLTRREGEVATAFGNIMTKEGYLGDARLRVTAEFESCRQAAQQFGVPIQHVYQAVERALGNL
ncbi:MAG: LarC family nickel insertion protein, partial [Verrucomicrobiota bacterium]